MTVAISHYHHNLGTLEKHIFNLLIGEIYPFAVAVAFLASISNKVGHIDFEYLYLTLSSQPWGFGQTNFLLLKISLTHIHLF